MNPQPPQPSNDRLAELVDAARARRAARRQERAEFAAARDVGLARRHVTKLARGQAAGCWPCPRCHVDKPIGRLGEHLDTCHPAEEVPT